MRAHDDPGGAHIGMATVGVSSDMPHKLMVQLIWSRREIGEARPRSGPDFWRTE